MSSSTVTSLSVVPIFLTRPLLFLGVKPTVVSAITTFLQDFFRVSGGKSQTLKLRPAILPSLPEIAAHCNADTISLMKTYFGHFHTVDSAPIPPVNLAVPIPLAFACHFFGLTWNDWFMSLGGSEFELVLDPRCVYVVKKVNGCIGVVWTNNSMFAGVIRPSVIVPIRTGSPYLPSNSYPEDIDISRPSSRSSSYSNFSFSSHSSASSQSSIASVDAAHTNTQFSTSIPMKSTLISFTNTDSAPKSSNTPTARFKAPSTRYLYRGGMSTVLTGGVMLGTSL